MLFSMEIVLSFLIFSRLRVIIRSFVSLVSARRLFYDVLKWM